MISELQKPVNSDFGAKSEPSEVLEGIDLNGKVAMVTGGYSGIGIETVRGLKDAGAKVIVPARRTDVAKSELSGIVEEKNIVEMDLANPASVSRFVNEFQDSETPLDILINNAAVMACPKMPTKEGWDLQFAVNHIGHFILTKGLLNTMSKSLGARIVTLSSTGHKLSGIQWDDVHFEESYDKWKAYGQSKTAASLLAVEISNRGKDKGIKAYSVHPGGIFTPLQRHLEQEEMIALGWLGEDGELSEMAAANFKSTTQGAATSLWCATSPLLDDVSGVYCENCDVAARQENGPMARYVGVADWAVDTDDASRLWDLTEHTLSF
ncbi:MAG: oxidoreductase [Gammaproteobacteria bacterium]|nr:oxidoreductase [Gammaproteobacteria bacterium]HBW82823.1 oxidoreductase [Gammaproteobacteria bacterium]|tara:strand:- start:17413 stop:18381 length:969 start_codon:yes stop_codon:yes gene_type:complete